MKKRPPYTVEEHKKLAADLRQAQEILEPYLEDFWKRFGVRDKKANLLAKVLNILSSKLCNELDKKWFEITENDRGENRCPYYGSGKKAYFK